MCRISTTCTSIILLLLVRASHAENRPLNETEASEQVQVCTGAKHDRAVPLPAELKTEPSTRPKVFDGGDSEITLIIKKNRYFAWSNVTFAQLGGIGSFDTEGRSYSYFGMAAQVDDLIDYYVANEADLRVVFKNPQMLQAARELHKTAHPAVAQDSVLNYSRVSDTPKEVGD